MKLILLPSVTEETSFRLSVFVWSAIAFFWHSAAKCKQGVQPHLNVHTWAQIYSICFKACQRSAAGLGPTLKPNPLFPIVFVFQPFQDSWRLLAQHSFHWSSAGTVTSGGGDTRKPRFAQLRSFHKDASVRGSEFDGEPDEGGSERSKNTKAIFKMGKCSCLPVG